MAISLEREIIGELFQEIPRREKIEMCWFVSKEEEATVWLIGEVETDLTYEILKGFCTLSL